MTYPKRQLQLLAFANQVEVIDRAIANGSKTQSQYSYANPRYRQQGSSPNKYAVAAVAAAAAVHQQQTFLPPKKAGYGGGDYLPQPSPQPYPSAVATAPFEGSPPLMFLLSSPLKLDSLQSPPKSGQFMLLPLVFVPGCNPNLALTPWGLSVMTPTLKTTSIWGSGLMW